MGCDANEKDFKFWMPLDVVKAPKGEMRIGGVATDEESPDIQGERVFIDGLDISYLLQRGAFNWDHGKGPGDILGEIDIAMKQGKKLYVEGPLYPHVEKAKEVYDLMRSLKENGSNRKLGLSVEGKVKERDVQNQRHIRKAWIKNVAVTYNPINQGTWVDFVKSLGTFIFEKCDKECVGCTFCEVEKSESEGEDSNISKTNEVTTNLQPSVKQDSPVADKSNDLTSPSESSKEDVEKAGLSAGHDIPAVSGGISGSALRKESLETGPAKVTTYKIDEEDSEEKRKNNEIVKESKKLSKKKRFTKSELSVWLQEIGYSPTVSELMTDLIFKAVEVAGYIRTRKGHLERVSPFRRELFHEAHRMGTMSEKALMTRATKITNPSKLLHFFNIAKDKGMNDLAAVIKHEGRRRLGLKDSDFEDVRKEIKYYATA